MSKLKFSEPISKIRGKGHRKLLFYPAGISDGCTHFRFEMVRNSLNCERKAEVQLTNIIQETSINSKDGKILNYAYSESDAIVLQRPVRPRFQLLAKELKNIQNLIESKGLKPFRFIIDIDDVINHDDISDYNVSKRGYLDGTRFDTFRKSIKFCDELHVASREMEKYYRDTLSFDNITYRPNFLPRYLYDGFYDEDIQYRRYEKHSKRPRIVWAGSWSHFDAENNNGGKDDFSELISFIKKTSKKYQWVFYGAHPMQLLNGVKNGIYEYYNWSSILGYPQKLWSLEPTVFIAPLEDNIFNRCKSNIKLTEMGVMGIGGVYQDIEPYKEAPLKFNNVVEFESGIDYLLKDWDNYLSVIRKNREYSNKFFMEDNLDFLMSTYIYPYGDIRRDKYSLDI